MPRARWPNLPFSLLPITRSPFLVSLSTNLPTLITAMAIPKELRIKVEKPLVEVSLHYTRPLVAIRPPRDCISRS